MVRPKYDLLWKDIISLLFEEFLLFFSPDLNEQVDFSTPPEFLEQELQTIFPTSESSKRLADKLVKLKLKSGKEQWVYIHIEVQGSYEKHFAKRMFQSFYRILDLYDRNIYALAIFTNDESKYNPNTFYYEFYGTKLKFRYNTYRIVEQSEQKLLQSSNPFALAVLAGRYATKSKKDVDLKYKYKRTLLRLLLEDKILGKDAKKEYIQRLFIFIDHLLTLPKEMEHTFIRELSPIIEREGTNLGLSLEDTSFAKYYLREGKEKGRMEGKLEKAIEIATKLLAKGVSIEEIAEMTDLPVSDVTKLKDEIM